MQFAQDNLAKPLGFTLAKWTADPQGIHRRQRDVDDAAEDGSSSASCINDGKPASNTVIAKLWIHCTRAPARPWPRWQPLRYGYGFCIREFAGDDSYYAWGYGGQFIFIVPDKDCHAYRRRDLTPPGATTSTRSQGRHLTLY